MLAHQATLEKSPSKIAIPECFLHNDSSSATSSRGGGGGSARAGAASASDLVTPPTLPLAQPQLCLGSPVASACSSDPCGVLTPGRALHTPVSGPLALDSSSCGALEHSDSIGEDASSLLLTGARRQRRSSGPRGGGLRGKRESFTVLDCQSDYTQVWRCDVGDDGVAERRGMRRLPSIRNLLGGGGGGGGRGGGDGGGEACGGGGGGGGGGEASTTADLLDPLREMLLGDQQVIVTAGSGIRGDIVDGHVDRMQYARLKRDIQETCCGTDFVTMTPEEELAAVWRAVLRRTPAAGGVVHLGDTFFGLATGAASAVEEYMRDDAAASLAHHVEAVRWVACGGVVVLVERVAETLHEACDLRYGVEYPRDDVLEAAALAELSDEGGAAGIGGSADDRRRRTAVFAFVSTALEKLVAPEATVLLDQHSSSSMGALVNRVDEDELVASFLEEDDEEEEEEETNETS